MRVTQRVRTLCTKLENLRLGVAACQWAWVTVHESSPLSPPAGAVGVAALECARAVPQGPGGAGGRRVTGPGHWPAGGTIIIMMISSRRITIMICACRRGSGSLRSEYYVTSRIMFESQSHGWLCHSGAPGSESGGQLDWVLRAGRRGGTPGPSISDGGPGPGAGRIRFSGSGLKLYGNLALTQIIWFARIVTQLVTPSCARAAPGDRNGASSVGPAARRARAVGPWWYHSGWGHESAGAWLASEAKRIRVTMWYWECGAVLE